MSKAKKRLEFNKISQERNKELMDKLQNGIGGLRAYMEGDEELLKTLIWRVSDIKDNYSAQLPSSEVRVSDLDNMIEKVIKDGLSDIKNSRPYMVDMRLDKLRTFISERGEYCPESSLSGTPQDERRNRRYVKMKLKEEKRRQKEIDRKKRRNIPVEQIYSDEELAKQAVEELITHKEKLNSRLQQLHDRLVNDPDDERAKAEWYTVKNDYKVAEKRLEMWTSENQRDSLIKAMGALTAEQKKLVAERKVSDAEFNVLQAEYDKVIGNIDDQARIIQEAQQKLDGSSSSANGVAGFVPEEDFEMSARKKEVLGSVFNDPLFKKFGEFSMSGKTLKELYAQVGPYMNRLDSAMDDIESLVDEKQSERDQLAVQINALLDEWDKAPESKRLIIESKLDRLVGRDGQLTRQIMQEMREQAQYIEMQRIMGEVQSFKESEDRRDILEGKTKMFTRLDNISMLMRDKNKAAEETYKKLAINRGIALDGDITIKPLTVDEDMRDLQTGKSDVAKIEKLKQYYGQNKA